MGQGVPETSSTCGGGSQTTDPVSFWAYPCRLMLDSELCVPWAAAPGPEVLTAPSPRGGGLRIADELTMEHGLALLLADRDDLVPLAQDRIGPQR